MSRIWSPFTLGSVLLGIVLVGCESLPPPRTVYQDPLTAIQLRVDRQAGQGHHHPATIPAAQMARILDGIRVQKRGDPILSLVTGQPEIVPAFSSAEIQTLAAPLSHALTMASPQELVTFYRRYSDTNVGLAVTSGGLFVQDQHVYIILANARNRPADVMGHSQAFAHEIDPVDDPLLSLKPGGFAVRFTPAEAVAQDSSRRDLSYPDPGKVLVIDLDRLTASNGPTSSPSR